MSDYTTVAVLSDIHGNIRALNAVLEEVQREQPDVIVVCGHTHHQFDRRIGGYRVVNAGSVGMPYEGTPGAFWALLGPDLDLRKTEYDFERAVGEALSTGYPDPAHQGIILNPPKSDEVAAFFEKFAADRGERDLP